MSTVDIGRGPAIDAHGAPLDELEPEPITPGMFVFLRNSRFQPSVESPACPRYWVGRVVTLLAPDRTTGLKEAKTFGFSRTHSRAKLQWHRETSVGSNLYVCFVAVVEARARARVCVCVAWVRV